MMLSLIVSSLISAPPIALPIKVDGEGYLRFLQGQKVVYARSATLVIAKGKVADIGGAILMPQIAVGGHTQRLKIELDGTIWAVSGTVEKSLSRLVLAIFPASAHLTTIAHYLATTAKPKLGSPGDGVFGVIREASKAQSKVRIFAPDGDETKTDTVNIRANHATAGKSEIRLRPVVTVETDAILFGDIAHLDSDDAASRDLRTVNLGAAPPQSVDRVLDKGMILAKLREAGYDPEKFEFVGTTKVTVRRASQDVTESQFIEAAKAEAEKTYGQGLETVTKATMAAMVVPKGQLELVIEGVLKSGTNINVTVAAFVNGNRINARTVVLRTDPNGASSLRVGQTVNIRISSGGVMVEVRGVVKSINQTTSEVQVQSESGASFTGKAGKDGAVEVSL